MNVHIEEHYDSSKEKKIWCRIKESSIIYSKLSITGSAFILQENLEELENILLLSVPSVTWTISYIIDVVSRTAVRGLSFTVTADISRSSNNDIDIFIIDIKNKGTRLVLDPEVKGLILSKEPYELKNLYEDLCKYIVED